MAEDSGCVNLAEIEALLEREVRPKLQEHGGDLRLTSLDGDILRLRLLGQCAHCPAASLTNETLIEETVQQYFPMIKRVVLEETVSDELLSMARKLLAR